MEAHELVEKFRNNAKMQASYEEILKWSNENAEKLDLSNEDHRYLAIKSMWYLMNKKIGNWSKEDAIFAINYCAKDSSKKLGLSEKIGIKVLEKEEAEQLYKNAIRGICDSYGDNTFDITYLPAVIEDLTSSNKERFLDGLQTVYHELTHVKQNIVIKTEEMEGFKIPKTKTIYFMALEDLAKKYEPQFYRENYGKLIKENNANKAGLIQAMEIIKKYGNPQEYDEQKIAQKLKKYDSNFYDATTTLENGKTYDFRKKIETLCSKYISSHPESIQKYPILKVAYNLDGTKKNIKQLLQDRETMLKNGEKIEQINELYESIINHRNTRTGGLKGKMNEIRDIDSYIRQNGTEDEFIFDLLRYQLEHGTTAAPDKVEQIIKEAREAAIKTREQQGIREKEAEIQEGIKDEVGDEFKPKTEERKQEEQEINAMWRNRLQSWDRDAINLPNSAKREQQAAKAISDVIREKENEKDKAVKSQVQNELG